MSAIPSPKNSESPADPLADDRALWDLLDHASPPPAPGPFFTRRVLRLVANLEEERAATAPAWRRRLAELFATRPRTAWSGASFVGAAAAVMLTVGTFGLRSGTPRVHPRLPVVTTGETEVGGEPAAVNLTGSEVRESDVGVITDLDELTDSNENHVWQDEADESTS